MRIRNTYASGPQQFEDLLKRNKTASLFLRLSNIENTLGRGKNVLQNEIRKSMRRNDLQKRKQKENGVKAQIFDTEY